MTAGARAAGSKAKASSASLGLTGFWALVRASGAEYRRWGRSLLGLALAVGLPVAAASTWLLDTSSDSAMAAYLTLAQLTLNAALIFAILTLRANPSAKISWRQIYYDSSVVLVRLVLLAALLFLFSFPLILGGLIITYGLVIPGVAPGLGEQILLIILALLALAPGTIILLRSMWSVYILFESPAGPLQAVGISWRLSKGFSTALFNRLFGLGILLLIVVLPLTAALLWAQTAWHSNLFGFILQLILSVVVLPFATLYLTKLYQELPR